MVRAHLSIMPRHVWESDSDSPDLADSDSDDGGVGGRHPWPDGEGSDGDGLTEAERLEAADTFIDEMTSLLIQRTLSANIFTVLMFHAGRAGIKDCARLGVKPDAPSGHPNRHLKKVLPLYRDDKPAYKYKVPCATKRQLGRGKHDFNVLVPTEELQREFEQSEGLREQLEDAIQTGAFPPSYDTHPVVEVAAAVARLVLPVAIFIDGVPYSNTDSIIGFWMVNLLTRRSHLFAAIRKQLLCTCGCRGWCTFQAIFYFIHCQALQLAAGEFGGRHDGLDWHEQDYHRRTLVGTQLMFNVCILYIQGDWAEYAKTLGFAAWNDSVRPCFGCNGWGRLSARRRGCMPDGNAHALQRPR